MFQAVRKWWHSGRGQRTARLFVFELTVVMVGVLAAQQVSNWAQKRSALGQVEGIHRDLFHSFAAYRAIAAADQAAIPCLQQRVQTILLLAGDRSRVDGHLLAPAPLMGMAEDSISSDNEQLLRERYSDAVADRMISVEFSLGVVGDRVADLDRRWFEFQRLNPLHGAVTDTDRSAVREAAVQIMGDLSSLRWQTNAILNLTRELGIPRMSGIAPVTSCQQMWRSGRGFLGG